MRSTNGVWRRMPGPGTLRSKVLGMDMQSMAMASGAIRAQHEWGVETHAGARDFAQQSFGDGHAKHGHGVRGDSCAARMGCGSASRGPECCVARSLGVVLRSRATQERAETKASLCALGVLRGQLLFAMPAQAQVRLRSRATQSGSSARHRHAGCCCQPSRWPAAAWRC